MKKRKKERKFLLRSVLITCYRRILAHPAFCRGSMPLLIGLSTGYCWLQYYQVSKFLLRLVYHRPFWKDLIGWGARLIQIIMISRPYLVIWVIITFVLGNHCFLLIGEYDVVDVRRDTCLSLVSGYEGAIVIEKHIPSLIMMTLSGNACLWSLSLDGSYDSISVWFEEIKFKPL